MIKSFRLLLHVIMIIGYGIFSLDTCTFLVSYCCSRNRWLEDYLPSNNLLVLVSVASFESNTMKVFQRELHIEQDNLLHWCIQTCVDLCWHSRLVEVVTSSLSLMIIAERLGFTSWSGNLELFQSSKNWKP